MKYLKLLSLLLVTTFVFSSCSNNDNALPEPESGQLLKSFKVKRDATGSYSVDYDLNENVRTENVVNDTRNSSQFYLYASNDVASRKESQDLVIDGKQLKVGFIDTNTNYNPNVLIEDDNITLAKGNENGEMLSEFSISSNEDGTFSLDFKVEKNVTVDFVYNNDEDIYEVHLEPGKTSNRDYSRAFTKEADKLLRIDFVNHIITDSNYAAKGLELEYVKRRKPRVSVGNGESVEN